MIQPRNYVSILLAWTSGSLKAAKYVLACLENSWPLWISRSCWWSWLCWREHWVCCSQSVRFVYPISSESPCHKRKWSTSDRSRASHSLVHRYSIYTDATGWSCWINPKNRSNNLMSQLTRVFYAQPWMWLACHGRWTQCSASHSHSMDRIFQQPNFHLDILRPRYARCSSEAC